MTVDIDTAPEKIEDTRVGDAQTGALSSRSNNEKAKFFSRALTAILVLALGFFGGWLGAESRSNEDDGQTITQQRTILKNEGNLISEIASKVGKSVVSVNVTSRSTATSMYNLWFMPETQAQQSAGTGIILTEDGLIITNRHVVPQGTTSVSITLSDGSVLEGVKVVGRTGESDSLDIAFLQVVDKKGKTLVPAVLGDSSLTDVGDTVVAIGNTLGQFQNTVTSGIISGYGRSIIASNGENVAESLDDLFQTDAAINEGNSGGPLVNLAGEVIGINTAIASNSQNVGFAIPINNVIGLVRTVKETGKLQRPYLGIRYIMLTDDIAKEYGLKTSRGAYIPQATAQTQPSVVAGSPAAQAGVKEGDVITKVAGTTVGERASLTSILGNHKIGDIVELTVIRGDDTVKLKVKLGIAPS